MDKTKHYSTQSWERFRDNLLKYANEKYPDIKWNTGSTHWSEFNDLQHCASRRCKTAYLFTSDKYLITNGASYSAEDGLYGFWFPNEIIWDNKTHRLAVKGSGRFFGSPIIDDGLKKALDDFVEWRRKFLLTETVYVTKLKAFENAMKFMIKTFDPDGDIDEHSKEI